MSRPNEDAHWFGDLRPILDDDLARFVAEQDRHRSLTVVADPRDHDAEADTRRWLDALRDDPATTDQCAAMVRAVERHADGSRDGMLRGALAVVRLDELGHAGVAAALDQLWSVRAKDRRDYDRVIAFARRRVVESPSPAGRRGCRCRPPVQQDDDQEEDMAVEAVLPDPTPLRAARVPVAFPTDALPGWVGDWVRAEAHATQTPEDLAGVCALAVLAACAGGRVEVEPRCGWREPSNLYALPVMPPGSRKSAVIAAATRPLYGAEQDLSEAVKVEQVETSLLRDVATKAAKIAMEKAATAAATGKGDADGLRSAAISAAAQEEALQVPVTPRLIADDATVEAVGTLLAEHGGRLAIISAEGGVFDIIAGRYTNGVASLDVFLKGHAGDPLRVDRKGRPSEYVPKPALTMLLTVQPAVLAALAGNATFRGRGLTARFLYCLPVDNVGRRLVGAAPVPPEVADAYDKRVRALVHDLSGWTDPAVLHLDDEAGALLLDLERSVEPRLARDGDYGSIREWASKLVGAILRIAAVLHIAGDGEQFRRPVTAETLQAAILLGGYFVDHAQAAFDLIGDGGTSDAAYLLEFLARRGADEFTSRSLLTDLPRGRFSSADDVNAAVQVLVEHGWILPQPAPERSGPGRRPSPRFRVHPAVSAESAQSAESNRPRTRLAVSLVSAESAVSAEPTDPPDSADSADIADTSTHRRRRRRRGRGPTAEAS